MRNSLKEIQEEQTEKCKSLARYRAVLHKSGANMKPIELRLIGELMKNSRRSDRQLAKALGISQPTVSRLIKKLEKEGIIREYTIIPDFRKLGYEIMGITSVQVTEKPQIGSDEIRKATLETEKSNPHAGLMIVNGMGGNKNRLFIDFFENYSQYSQVISAVRQFPFIDVDSIETFLVNLEDKTNLRLLSMSTIADHLLFKSAE
jgi:DNA-binding Lrp family transcriptional regulator